MKISLTVLLYTLAFLVYGQKDEDKTPGFDRADFSKKFEVVEWLAVYDNIAWGTSDSAIVQDKKEIDRLGNEWFCFQDINKTWHAVYGKYADNSFDLVFHFTVDNNAKVKRVYDKVDSSLLNSYSRALITANKQLTKLRDTVSVGFNQFIKKNDDKTFTVWILPAFQKNRVAVYGGEFIYTIDPSGHKVLKDESYVQDFRGFKVNEPREITLNYMSLEKATLGSIFFVWYYKRYFTFIHIDTQKSESTLFKHEEDGSYYWVHFQKELKDK